MKRALLFSQLPDKKVKCRLCAHSCLVNNGHLGICRVRKNIKGELFSLSYDKIAAIHADPIEKKPLYHFQPASKSFSVATMGCNFRCSFCQNHSLSMVEDENQIFGEKKSPRQLVELALQSGSRSISYTYTEPTIFFELMVETALIAKENGLKNVMVTNGYMSGEALEQIQPYLDAANIDLKAFSDRFYKENCNARLQPVLDTIIRMKERDIWIELTTLLIPGLNTNPKEIEEMIHFILNLDQNIPWHISLFFPHYRLLDRSSTDVGAITDLLRSAKKRGIKFLYGGNFDSDEWSDTRCPECQAMLVNLSGYHTQVMNISQGRCQQCGTAIPGVRK